MFEIDKKVQLFNYKLHEKQLTFTDYVTVNLVNIILQKIS